MKWPLNSLWALALGKQKDGGGGRTDLGRTGAPSFHPYPKLEMPGGPGPPALLSYLGRAEQRCLRSQETLPARICIQLALTPVFIHRRTICGAPTPFHVLFQAQGMAENLSPRGSPSSTLA